MEILDLFILPLIFITSTVLTCRILGSTMSKRFLAVRLLYSTSVLVILYYGLSINRSYFNTMEWYVVGGLLYWLSIVRIIYDGMEHTGDHTTITNVGFAADVNFMFSALGITTINYLDKEEAVAFIPALLIVCIEIILLLALFSRRYITKPNNRKKQE